MHARQFPFERGTTTEEALPVIRAALADEGLALAPAYSHGKITSVIRDGLVVFKVPAERIVDPEQAAAFAIVAREHYARARAERDAAIAASQATPS